jgi:hypothetical protein
MHHFAKHQVADRHKHVMIHYTSITYTSFLFFFAVKLKHKLVKYGYNLFLLLHHSCMYTNMY